MRQTLLSALETWADPTQRRKTHLFLMGLSCDELQYIADFVGASVLDSLGGCESRAQLAALVADFQRSKCCPSARADDQDCKAILLLEYLCRGGGRRLQAVHTARA